MKIIDADSQSIITMHIPLKITLIFRGHDSNENKQILEYLYISIFYPNFVLLL